MWTTCAGAGFGGRHRQDLGGFRSTCATNARSAAVPNRADQALGPCPRGPDARQNWGKFNAHKWERIHRPLTCITFACVPFSIHVTVLAVTLLLAIANARPEWCGQLNGTVLGGCADALSRHASCSATSRRLVDTLSMSKSAAPAHRIIPP